MAELADEVEARLARRDDLLADRDDWRGLLEITFSGLQTQISLIYALRSFVSPREAMQVDERLAPIREAIGWDAYPDRPLPLDGSSRPGRPTIEHLLRRPFRDDSGFVELQADADEFRRVQGWASSMERALVHIVDELRTVVPEGTTYTGRKSDAVTRQAMIAAWREAAEILRIGVVAPCAVETDGGPLPGIALLVGVGAPQGTLLLDINDFHEFIRRVPLAEQRGYRVRGVRPETYSRFDRAEFELLLEDSRTEDVDPVYRLMRLSEPECPVDLTQDVYRPELHTDVQDTDCAAWRLLLELIDEAAADGRETFTLHDRLPRSLRRQIVTLPRTISKLIRVKHLDLYGSSLIAIPPEIGQMTDLETFSPYTSRRLHWFPYEITRCRALRDSTVSTRNVYGNSKLRMPFPELPAAVPGSSTPTNCSVCGRALPGSGVIQVWISLWVATDVLPLLVHACSHDCVRSLPDPAEGYVDRPHRGGAGLVQPDAQMFGRPPSER